jgi:hypothetical protein
VRLGDPAHQVGLLIFLWNSGVKAIERIGADSLRIADEDMSESQIRHVLDVWLSRHPSVRLETTPSGGWFPRAASHPRLTALDRREGKTFLASEPQEAVATTPANTSAGGRTGASVSSRPPLTVELHPRAAGTQHPA